MIKMELKKDKLHHGSVLWECSISLFSVVTRVLVALRL